MEIEVERRSDEGPQPYIGLGFRASTVHIGRSGPTSAGGGVLLRFRARPVEIELDIGRDEYLGDSTRSDTRIGANLYVPLAWGRLTPFLVVGTGMSFSHFGATGDELHQGYLAGGGGVSFPVARRFSLELDARFMLRQFFDDDAVVARQGIDRDEPSRDQALEVRLAGIFYF